MQGRVAAIVEQSWHRVPGGTATSTVRTLAALAARGDWEVIGVAAKHDAPPEPFVEPPVVVCHMGLRRRPLYAAWHRLRRPSIQARTGPVDVVHATGGVIPPAGDAALVVTIHDLAFFHDPRHFTRRGVGFMTRAFELAKRDANMILVPSSHTYDDCRAHGISADRLRVVPWGVTPTTVDDGARADVRRRYSLPPDFLLWVGTAEPRKNLTRLVAAVAQAPTQLPLILVGPSGWGVDTNEIVSASSVDVRHLGAVPTNDLAVLYDLARVFVYPSLREGFGMPVLEAMAQGTAVVTSANTSTEEVAGEAGRLVDPTDVSSIAAGIDAVLSNDELRASLATAGAARAATMSWDQTATATAAAYESSRT